MTDLISRQVAIDASEKFIKDCNPDHFVGHQKFIEYMDNAEIGSFGKWQFANGFNMGLTAAEVAIKKLPSAEPVRHGKWANDAIGVLRCSECNAQAPWKYGKDYIDYRWKANYCPNCGADMRGEE